jgi:hypothetical protein
MEEQQDDTTQQHATAPSGAAEPEQARGSQRSPRLNPEQDEDDHRDVQRGLEKLERVSGN